MRASWSISPSSVSSYSARQDNVGRYLFTAFGVTSSDSMDPYLRRNLDKPHLYWRSNMMFAIITLVAAAYVPAPCWPGFILGRSPPSAT
jgi:hypothetical protein